MDTLLDKVGTLLREAARLHHEVYRITDGEDEDWALWYADWLVRLSELPDVLPVRPTRSELTSLLVQLDRAFGAEPRDEEWPEFYARQLVSHFDGGDS